MKLRNARLALSTSTVLAVLAAAVAAGCSSSTKKKVPFDQDASAGDAGSSGTAGASSLPTGGNGGTAGEAGASGEAGLGGELAQGGDSGAGQAGASTSLGGSGGAAVVMPPDIDAGIGCSVPSGESGLAPASAGLPAAGLRLWLRGDYGVYKTADNRVCAWADQSGHDYVFTSTADDARPVFTSTGLGGMPAVHFDASGRILTIDGVLGLAPTSARTLVAVVQLVDTSSRVAVFQQGQSMTPGTYLGIDTNTYNTAGSREGVYLMNNSYDAALPTASTPRVHVYTIGTMTPGTPILGAVDYRVNGAPQTLTRNQGGLGNGTFEDFSGANFSLIGGGPDVVIAEALVYDRALSTAERASVEQALETRYGIH